MRRMALMTALLLLCASPNSSSTVCMHKGSVAESRRRAFALCNTSSPTFSRLPQPSQQASGSHILRAVLQQAFMEYWERELVQALLEAPAGAHTDVAALSRRSGIAHGDIIEALAQPGARLEELKIVVWKRTGYDVDVKSIEALQVRLESGAEVPFACLF